MLEWNSSARSSGRASAATGLGADKIGKGKSHLEYAAVSCNAEAFGELWNGASHGRLTANYKALALAVKTNNAEGVRMLLRTGADPDGFVEEDDKLIVYAARHGMEEIIQLLISAGAELTQAALVAVESMDLSLTAQRSPLETA